MTEHDRRLAEGDYSSKTKQPPVVNNLPLSDSWREILLEMYQTEDRLLRDAARKEATASKASTKLRHHQERIIDLERNFNQGVIATFKAHSRKGG